jgi:hypothetical protein
MNENPSKEDFKALARNMTEDDLDDLLKDCRTELEILTLKMENLSKLYQKVGWQHSSAYIARGAVLLSVAEDQILNVQKIQNLAPEILVTLSTTTEKTTDGNETTP